MMLGQDLPPFYPEKKKEVTWSPPDSQRALPGSHGRQAGT
jgi:hypothetical protein